MAAAGPTAASAAGAAAADGKGKQINRNWQGGVRAFSGRKSCAKRLNRRCRLICRCFLLPPAWFWKLQRARLGQRKSREPSEWSKLHLPSPGFFGLLRNLRPAKRAGPDLGRLFIKFGWSRYSGIALSLRGERLCGAYTTSDLASLGHLFLKEKAFG